MIVLMQKQSASFEKDKIMRITAIHNTADHRSMLSKIEALWDAKPNTAEHDELEVLSILVEKYEEKTFPISDPDPVQAVLFYIEQNGLKRADLGKTLGSRSRASEFLNRKSDLSITQIRKLHDEWHIPADILIQPVAV